MHKVSWLCKAYCCGVRFLQTAISGQVYVHMTMYLNEGVSVPFAFESVSLAWVNTKELDARWLCKQVLQSRLCYKTPSAITSLCMLVLHRHHELAAKACSVCEMQQNAVHHCHTAEAASTSAKAALCTAACTVCIIRHRNLCEASRECGRKQQCTAEHIMQQH